MNEEIKKNPIVILNSSNIKYLYLNRTAFIYSSIIVNQDEKHLKASFQNYKYQA